MLEGWVLKKNYPDHDVKVTLNFTIYMKEFFLYYPIVTAWRKSVDSKYLLSYNKSIQRRFNILFIKLFCIWSFITLYLIHPDTTQECQKITTQECQKIQVLEKVVENCRIYEVSKKVVEKCCRNQSKNVVEMSKMCFLIFPTP